MSVGQWEIEGRLGRDPLFKGDADRQYAILNVACDKGYGETKKTVWISVFARKTALKQARHLKKGDLVNCKGDPSGMMGRKRNDDGTETPEAQVVMSCFNLKHILWHKEEEAQQGGFEFSDPMGGGTPPAFKDPPARAEESHPANTAEEFVESGIGAGVSQSEMDGLPI